MNTYCLKCKKSTKDINSKGVITKNKKYLVKSTCNICKSKKSKFVSKQHAQWILIKSLFKNTNIKSNNIIYELL